MKIGIVLPGADGTGGIKVLYEYGKRLEKRGHDVIFYSPIIFYNLKRANKIKNYVRCLYVTIKNVIDKLFFKLESTIEEKYGVHLRMVPYISDRYLRENNVIIASAWMTAFDVSKLDMSKGKKAYFVQGFEIWDNAELGRQSYGLPLKKIVIADWIKERIIQENLSLDDNIPIVYNGIDTNVFHNQNKDYSHKKIRCLMLYHTLEKKGVVNGIRAFKIARNICKHELEMTMFGIQNAVLDEDMKYYRNPTIEQLVELYCNSDIFIFPSLEEGWGLTPIEAMACKCAVVGTRTGCMMTIGEHGQNVLLSNPGDVMEMAKQIVQLAENEELRMKISEKGYLTVKELDWENSVSKMEKILQDL